MTTTAAAGLTTVGIVGTGLIGTSVGLALRAAGVDVLLDDVDQQRVRLAGQLGAGRGWPAGEAVQHVVLAVPPARLPDAVLRWQREQPDSTLSDVSSVQVEPRRAAAARDADLSRWCGGHPMAGRERSGPAAARGDLFAGRTWVLCPDAHTSEAARADAAWVARTCRGQVTMLEPAEHDEAVALVSHLPQLVASLLAAQLEAVPAPALLLAAQGLRDTTRLAGSDAQLWAQIVAANRPAVLAALRPLQRDLGRLVDALGSGDPTAAVEWLVRRGSAGHRRLPGKHGGRVVGFASVPVVVADRPGELARLLADAATIGVNVEDLAVEHDPGRAVGVIELAVKPERTGVLIDGLQARGWAVHPAPSTEEMGRGVEQVLPHR